MAKFKKTILRVGQYRSLDGTVKVTPSRLRHWVNQFKQFSQAGNVVPVSFDHATEEDGLTPLSVNEFRSAQNTVGRLHDLRLSQDGKAAEMVLDIADPKAVQLARSNHVFVSPVLCQRWRDGRGNNYRDLWSHVDIVNHPVDSSQTPFQALSTAGTQYWRFALYGDEDLKDLEDDTEMGDDDMGDTDTAAAMGDDDMADALGDDDIAAAMGDTDMTPGPMDGAMDGTPADTGKLTEVLADLLQIGIVLGDDTNESNFLDRFVPALKTYVANNADSAGGDDDIYKDDPMEVEQPQFAQMSLAQRRVHEFAQTAHREKIRSRLNRLFVSGRCTRPELEEKRAQTEIVRLSLDSLGTPKASDVEKWIESRESLPKGTFWSKKVKAQRLSLSVESPPKRAGELSEEKAEKIAQRLLNRK